MKKIVFLVVSLLAMPMSASNASVLAQYPPSIQAPQAGQPIHTPVPAAKAGFTPVVPLARSSNIPDFSFTPISVLQAGLNAKSGISATALSVRPVKLTSNIVVGGIDLGELSQVPAVTVSSGSKREVQLASDVPTQITLNKLSKNSTASVVVVTSSGIRISLGTLKVSKSGNLVLPPFTALAKGVTATLQVSVGGKITSVALRATR